MQDHNIVRLEAHQTSRGAALLAQAFHHDPLYLMILPDEEKRARVLTWLFDRVIHYALAYGEVYTTPALEGVICWLSPDQTKLTMGRVMRNGLAATPFKLGLAAYRQFDTYMRYTNRWHEHYPPRSHWYLWAIGVDPSTQGKGIGGQLLQPVLSKASAGGTACYLETGIDRNVRFYEKHGFKVVDQGQVPPLELQVWAMLRESSGV
jgi:ribosomal protein S18 acetylase RimI-like enzyme